MDKVEIAKRLQEPFPPNEIEWRVDRGQKTQNGNYVFVLAYVTNRAIMNRLDDVFGPFGWRNEFMEWKGTSQLCGISIWDSERSEWVTKWDGSDDSNMDKVKGGISGAMKRTAVQWGIGRYLYNLEQNRVPLKQYGENWTSVKIKTQQGKPDEYITGYWDTPKLPDWALPSGFTGTQKAAQTTQESESNFAEESRNEDLAAIEMESKALIGSSPSTVTQIGNFINEGQTKMLYAKWKQSEYKDIAKPDVLELISAHLAKNVTDFKFVEKSDINKVIKWLDEHKAA